MSSIRIFLLATFILLGKISGYAQTNKIVELDSIIDQKLHSQKLEQVEPMIQQLLELSKDDPHYYERGLMHYGDYHQYQGDIEQAEDYYQQAINAIKNRVGTEDYAYAAVLNSLALLYQNQRKYEQALPLFLQTSQIYKNINPKSKAYLASLSNLGAIYRRMFKYDDAEATFKTAMSLAPEIYSESDIRYSGLINNFANFYNEIRQYDKAEPLFLKSMALRKKYLGEEHFYYAQSISNLGVLYYNLNQLEKSKAYHLKATAIYRKIVGSKNSAYLNSLNNLAVLEAVTENFEQALELCMQSLAANSGLVLEQVQTEINQTWVDRLSQANFGSVKDLDLTLMVAYDMVAMLSSEKDANTQQALIAELSMNILKKLRDGFIMPGEKLRSLRQSTAWNLRALEVLDHQTQVDKAFRFAEQTKSVLLMDASKTQKAYVFGNLPDSLIKKEQALLKQQARLNAALKGQVNRENQATITAELNELNLEIDAFSRFLEKAYPKYHALKYAPINISIQEVQELLPPKTALLEYVVGKQKSFVFYIDPQQAKLYTIEVSEDSLNKQIERFHSKLTDYESISTGSEQDNLEFQKLGYWFYQQLLVQALEGKTALDQLIIITDGALGHLPFESFLTSASTSASPYPALPYLIKSYAISYNYSAALWKEYLQKGSVQQNGKLLALAANYNAEALDSLATRSLRSPEIINLRDALNDLPAARKEIEALQKEFEGYFAFDYAATEKAFKNLAPNYGIIHLAMHGILHPKHPDLSSLAFTEDGDSLEDNFLQAHEISQMQLQAGLVVLSACETGYGIFQAGNGVASLAQSFAYAGVPAMLMTLWQINDASTALIMERFYQNLANGMNKAQALQKAKLSYLELAAESNDLMGHPAFWAAFVQFGDQRPLKLYPKQQGLNPWWWFAIGLGALMALTAVFRRLGRKA